MFVHRKDSKPLEAPFSETNSKVHFKLDGDCSRRASLVETIALDFEHFTADLNDS